MTGAFVLCPGRGSYARDELGWLGARIDGGDREVRELADRLEGLRAQHDASLPPLRELDREPQFRPGLHLAGRNASPLIFACTLVDAVRARREVEPVLAGGNSLGFYTSLVVSGALDVDEGYRLVSTMARLQEQGPAGGQLLWTLLDDDWQALPERVERLDATLEAVPDAGVSIRLGGHVVLAAGETGLHSLETALPKVRLGKRDFPFRLPLHGPFHTPLLATVAGAAERELAGLALRRPQVPLIDGRGYVWSPLWADVDALRAYTLRAQVTATFDFTTLVRVGLLDFAPETVELLAPGSSLRAPVGHVARWIDRGWPSALAAQPTTNT